MKPSNSTWRVDAALMAVNSVGQKVGAIDSEGFTQGESVQGEHQTGEW